MKKESSLTAALYLCIALVPENFFNLRANLSRISFNFRQRNLFLLHG